MVKRDYLWVVCTFDSEESNLQVKKKKEQEIFKILEHSDFKLRQLIKDEFERIALFLFGKILGDVYLNRLAIIYANVRIKTFLIRCRKKHKKEIVLLIYFMRLCEYFRVDIYYCGSTLKRCKEYIKETFINTKINENVSNILKELGDLQEEEQD